MQATVGHEGGLGHRHEGAGRDAPGHRAAPEVHLDPGGPVRARSSAWAQRTAATLPSAWTYSEDATAGPRFWSETPSGSLRRLAAGKLQRVSYFRVSPAVASASRAERRDSAGARARMANCARRRSTLPSGAAIGKGLPEEFNMERSWVCSLAKR